MSDPSNASTADSAPQGHRWFGAEPRSWLIFGLALASAIYPKLSFPAVFFCIVGLITVGWAGARALSRGLLAGAIALSTFSLFRFVTEEAIPGVLAGGKAAIEKEAVGYCRTLVTAEDHARTAGYLDPDGDGIGSALGFEELSGMVAVPGGAQLAEPPLALERSELRETALGVAVRQAGYLIALCLPSKGGGFSRNAADRDPERAEREYRLFAWPEALGPGSPKTAYFVDAREAILELPGTAEQPRYVGSTRPPPCDAVTRDGDWHPWNDKKPRDHLPGDKTEQSKH
jgi:hypothetical protein